MPVDHTDNQTRLQTELKTNDMSGAVITSRDNFVYLTGLRFDALWTSSARSMACVITADGDLTLVVPDFLAADAKQVVPGAMIVEYEAPQNAIDEVLLEALSDLQPGPVGLESGPESRFGAPLHSALNIHEALAARGIRDISEIMWKLRMHKSAAEIEHLQRAAEAGSWAFETVFNNEGIERRTELEIARSLSQHSIEAGAESAHWIAATSGAGSYHRFVSAPRDRTVSRGDMFWADIGLTANGYWTDFCRAAVAGPISQERMRLQEVVNQATRTGVKACLAGTPVASVATAIREKASSLGEDLLGYGRLGHGIGLSSTEPPSIAEWDSTVLEPGMVVTIEPAITNESGIYCAEQVVVVTEDEPVILTTARTELTET